MTVQIKLIVRTYGPTGLEQAMHVYAVEIDENGNPIDRGQNYAIDPILEKAIEEMKHAPMNRCYEMSCFRCLPEKIPSAAFVYCFDCHEWLCEDHANLHSRRDTFQQQWFPAHQAVRLTTNYRNIGPELKHSIKQSIRQSTAFIKHRCQRHDSPFTAFCMTCNTYVCSGCQLEELQDIQSINQSNKQSNKQANKQTSTPHQYQPLNDRWTLISRNWDQCTIQRADKPVTLPLKSMIKSLTQKHASIVEAINLVDKERDVEIQHVKQAVVELLELRKRLQKNSDKVRKQVRKQVLDLSKQTRVRADTYLTDRQSIDQLINQSKQYIKQMNYIALHQLLKSNNQSISQSTKLIAKFKPPIRKRFGLRSQPTCKCIIGLEIFEEQSLNPSSDPSTSHLDITPMITEFINNIDGLFEWWLYSESPISMERNEENYQKAEEQRATRIATKLRSINPSNKHLDNQSIDQTLNPNLKQLTCESTDQVNIQLSNQTRIEVTDLDDIIDEPRTVTWDDIISRMKSVTHSVKPSPYRPTRSNNQSIDQSINHSQVMALCEDFSFLCLDKTLYNAYIDDCSWDTIVYFVDMFMFHEITISSSNQSSQSQSLSQKSEQSESTNDVTELIYFRTLCDSLLNLLVAQNNDSPNRHVKLLHQLRRRAIQLIAPADQTKQSTKASSENLTTKQAFYRSIDPNSPYWPYVCRLAFALAEEGDLFPAMWLSRSKSICLPMLVCDWKSLDNSTKKSVDRSVGIADLKLVPALRFLDLSNSLGDQDFQRLSSMFKGLPELRTLILGFGRISEATIKSFFVNLHTHCTKLVELEMMSCEPYGPTILDGLKPFIGLTKLELGHMSEGSCVVLPDTLIRLRSLTDLSIVNTKFGKAGWPALAAVLPNLQLRTFSLCMSMIEDYTVLDRIGQCPSIKHLSLTDDCLDASSGPRLIEAIKKLPLLETLSLERNSTLSPDFKPLMDCRHPLKKLNIASVGAFDGLVLGKWLMNMPDLVSFNACSNKIYKLAQLCLHLTRNHKLKFLSLGNVNMEKEPSNGATFAASLPKWPELQQLVLQRSVFSPTQMLSVTRHLASVKSMEVLNISGCSISGCVQRFADAFKQMPQLKSLTMMGVQLTREEDCKFLGEALKFTPQLVYLEMGHNSVNSQAFARLVPGLSKLPRLRTLSLDGMFLASEAGKMIGEVLKHVPLLNELSVGGNPLGDLGVRHIAEKLFCIPVVERLTIYNCMLTDVGFKFLYPEAAKLKQLVSLAVYENRLGQRESERARALLGDAVYFG